MLEPAKIIKFFLHLYVLHGTLTSFNTMSKQFIFALSSFHNKDPSKFSQTSESMIKSSVVSLNTFERVSPQNHIIYPSSRTKIIEHTHRKFALFFFK
uniref:Uncharacterized protein n=1 Tax=Setaria italica TaxID=4555 RepID=K4APN1_SETIT